MRTSRACSASVNSAASCSSPDTTTTDVPTGSSISNRPRGSVRISTSATATLAAGTGRPLPCSTT